MSTKIKLTLEWCPSTDIPDIDECNSDFDLLIIDTNGAIWLVRYSWECDEPRFSSTYSNWELWEIAAWAYLPEGSTIINLFKGIKGE